MKQAPQFEAQQSDSPESEAVIAQKLLIAELTKRALRSEISVQESNALRDRIDTEEQWLASLRGDFSK